MFCGVFKDAVDILVTPIFTRVLTTEEYGLFNVYNSWYQIFRVIFTLNLCSDVYTVGLTKYGDDRQKYVSSVQGLLTVFIIILTIISFAAPSMWAEIMGISMALVFFMLLQIVAYVPYNGWLQQKRFEYKYRLITVVTVLYVILQPVIGLALIAVHWNGISGGELRIMGAVGVQIVFGLIIYVYNFAKKPAFFDKDIWRFSVRMNLPLIPHFLAQVLLLQSARLIIDAFIGKSATAIYSVANSAAFVILVIVLNLNSAFLPWLYQKLKKNDVAGIRSYTNILFLLSAASVLMIVLIAPEAMSLLAPPQYSEGIWVIPPLALSVHFLFTYTQFANIQLYYEKRFRVMVSAICGTAVCLGLGFLLIPVFGFVAAGYTTMAVYLTIAVIHYFFLHKTCREENIPVDELFNMRFILGLLLVLALLCAGVGLLYRFSPLLRYGLLLALVLVFIIKRKQLKSLFGEFQEKKRERKRESEQNSLSEKENETVEVVEEIDKELRQ